MRFISGTGNLFSQTLTFSNLIHMFSLSAEAIAITHPRFSFYLSEQYLWQVAQPIQMCLHTSDLETSLIEPMNTAYIENPITFH